MLHFDASLPLQETATGGFYCAAPSARYFFETPFFLEAEDFLLFFLFSETFNREGCVFSGRNDIFFLRGGPG